MGSNRANIIAAVAILALIILIVVLRVTVGLSAGFYLILGAALAAILSVLSWIFYRRRSENKFRRKLSSEGRELRIEYSFLRKVAGVPTKYRFSELETATDSFGALIGKGSSASVFKGILDDGTPVAVKRIEGVEHGESEFKAEVASIASVQHVNLVRLMGYCCVPRGPRLLVYQFVHNGSLNSWIFPQKSSSSVRVDARPLGFSCLPWAFRCRVAVDVAKALSYLHHDCRSKILHLDVKPENILLDEDFRAVVTDFGLSKSMGRDVSKIFTTVRGTEGYLAPEWLLEHGISEKSDIYSYGMVLLELVGGRRSVRLATEEDNTTRKWSFFQKIVMEKLKEGKIMEVVDKRLLEDGGDVDEKKVNILVNVALWCIQENPRIRPSMARVVDMLEERVSADSPPETGRTLLELLEGNDELADAEYRDRCRNQIENQLHATSSYSSAITVLSGR